MVERQPTLRPGDVVIALQLAIADKTGFKNLASATGLSVGECHNAVRRLAMARLTSPASRRPVTELLLRFMVHGVPCAFPAVVGAPSVGVATAYSAGVFTGKVSSEERFVWPDADGTERGLALTPLFPRAAQLATRNRALYDLLAIVDALRVGRTRERKVAEELLRERLSAAGSGANPGAAPAAGRAT